MATKSKGSFGSFAKAARLNVPLGLRQVAREIGISASYLSKVENDLDDPSGELMSHMARLYNVSMEELTRRAASPRASAAAHGHAVQASAELRALYRLAAQLEAGTGQEIIRRALRKKGAADRE